MNEPDEIAGVVVSCDLGVATLTLNRPERLNALTVEMLGQLRGALEELSRDREVRCVVIRGAGRAFCTGQDLADPAAQPDAPDGGVDVLAEHYNPLARWLAAAPFPTIAAVNGVAAGAGVSLALNCDLAIARRSASFVLSFAQLGLVPDTGATWWMPRLVGRSRALGISLLGEPLSAQDAAAWGLIWRTVDDTDFDTAVTATARRLAALPPAGPARIRTAMDRAWEQPFAAHLNLEHRLQLEAGRSSDYAEGLAAFREKRAPRFTGR